MTDQNNPSKMMRARYKYLEVVTIDVVTIQIDVAISNFEFIVEPSLQ